MQLRSLCLPPSLQPVCSSTKICFDHLIQYILCKTTYNLRDYQRTEKEQKRVLMRGKLFVSSVPPILLSYILPYNIPWLACSSTRLDQNVNLVFLLFLILSPLIFFSCEQLVCSVTDLIFQYWYFLLQHGVQTWILMRACSLNPL